MTVRTRFAPSPTGYLHIGGVRTALFNWLFTRRHGGRFVLRIDDTDVGRNRPEALQPILDGFRWLGVTWDEGPEVGGPYGPYFQSQRSQLYRDAALQLLDRGFAYADDASKEQLDALRKQAEAAKTNFVYRGRNRDLSPGDNRKLYDANPTVLRLKVPAGRKIAIDDQIAGRVEVDSDTISDPVILRADGSALYNFATVIDDVSMQITHVIRAKEHLSNTPVQVLVYEAMQYPLPTFAHVPVVNAPGSKEKLSKRKMAQFMTPEVIALLRAVHAVPADWTDAQVKACEDLNPATVAYYRTLGYLPASLVNYFGRLGWSLDDKTEVMSLDIMLEHFGLDRVNNSPASFDPKKLHWMAGEYMKQASTEAKVDGVLPILQRAGLVTAPVDGAARKKVGQVIRACGDRLAIFADILGYGAFFFREPAYDPQLVDKRLRKEGAPQLLRALRELLADVDAFDSAALDARVQGFCQETQTKLGDVNSVLRFAITGATVGPGLFDCLAILGKPESLQRIDHSLRLAGG